jgi:hypothetical protein
MIKSHFRNIAIVIAFSIFIIGCNSNKGAVTSTIPDQKTKEDLELTVEEPRDSTQLWNINVSEMNNMKDVGDAYQIISAKVLENQLWLTVSYGGGCKEHAFEMLFNNAYKEIANEFDSTDASLNLTLKHNGNNDVCRSIVRQNIRFNLKGIQSKGTNKVLIGLKNWEGLLTYTY